MKIIKYIQYHLQNISYMIRNKSTLIMIIKYLSSELKKLYFKRIYRNKINVLLLSLKNNFTLDIKFFSYERFYNILFMFVALKKKFNNNLKILEIGSFQGGTSLVLLKLFENSSLDIVDTWSDEFIEGNKDFKKIKFGKIEADFDKNLSQYKQKVQKFKSSSKSFFEEKFNQSNNQDKKYDIIYIDGSHSYEDVLTDAKNSSKCLNLNGIIIFDDYLWKQNDEQQNPINAINKFLNEEIKSFEIVFLYHQLIIKKIK